jgi:hypothetical protein
MAKGLIILGVFFILSWCWIAYEIWTAPLMPDDFELKDEDIWPLDERPIDEPEYDAAIDRHKPEEWDEDHALDMVLNDMVSDLSPRDISKIVEESEKESHPNKELKEAVEDFKEDLK